MTRSFVFATALMAVGLPAMASAQDQPAAIGEKLLADATVKAALAAAQANEPRAIEEQVRICEIPAPTGSERQRGEYLKKRFEELGLANVRIDRVGNVLGERAGAAPKPHLVFTAHLDTVFPEGTDVKVTREGPVLKGPGIGDDCRGLAVLLSVITAMKDAVVQTPGTITFVATVGEEGLGNLRGVRHLFNEELKGRIDRFVSVDGTGTSITHIAVGSRRYRVTFTGPGGHSYGAFGLANPVHALGRAIAKFADVKVPDNPKTTFNVGRVGGGTSVNSIAFEAWMEVDMRSANAEALGTLESAFLRAVDGALAEENARWKDKGRLSVTKDLVGDRPPGSTPAPSPIVVAAQSAARALGLTSTLDEGSTDSNVAINLKIPAITIDGGGRGQGAHSLGESFDTTDSWKGTQWATLVAIALAQP